MQKCIGRAAGEAGRRGARIATRPARSLGQARADDSTLVGGGAGLLGRGARRQEGALMLMPLLHFRAFPPHFLTYDSHMDRVADGTRGLPLTRFSYALSISTHH